MQRKLNEEFIDNYCEKFAEKVIDGFFIEGKGSITGKEILDITPSKQVNFFVIKLLFRYWQEETKKLESPFFNYHANEVKQAMIQFMNVLSQHIEIKKSKFKVLLNHAVKDTIYLAIAPEAYVEIDLESRGVDQIKEKSVEGTVKYLKIHKKEISDFLSDMKGLTVDDVIDELAEEFDDFDTSSAASKEFALLSEVLTIEQENILSDDPHMDEFDTFEEDEESIFEQGEEDLVEEKKKRKKEKKIAPDAQPENDIILSPEDEAMKMEEFDIEDQEIPSTDKIEPEEEEIEEVIEEEVKDEGDEFKNVEILDEEVEDDFPEETLNDQFNKKEETVADQLEKEIKHTEGSELMKSISVNNRYMFTKELFKEDKVDFENTIYDLDQLGSFDESVEYLVQGIAKENKWDMQSEVVKEFLKVLFRKFR